MTEDRTNRAHLIEAGAQAIYATWDQHLGYQGPGDQAHTNAATVVDAVAPLIFAAAEAHVRFLYNIDGLPAERAHWASQRDNALTGLRAKVRARWHETCEPYDTEDSAGCETCRFARFVLALIDDAGLP